MEIYLTVYDVLKQIPILIPKTTTNIPSIPSFLLSLSRFEKERNKRGRDSFSTQMTKINEARNR
jgi:hypothetical protein